MTRRFVAVLFAFTTVACRDVTAPVAQWAPADSLLAQVVECSGLPMPDAAKLPTWHLIPGDSVPYHPLSSGPGVILYAFGVHYPFDNKIELAEGYLAKSEGHKAILIRHEFLHELLFESFGIDDGSHPIEYFSGKGTCRDYVILSNP